jgi:hypothetical protein
LAALGAIPVDVVGGDGDVLVVGSGAPAATGVAMPLVAAGGAPVGAGAVVDEPAPIGLAAKVAGAVVTVVGAALAEDDGAAPGGLGALEGADDGGGVGPVAAAGLLCTPAVPAGDWLVVIGDEAADPGVAAPADGPITVARTMGPVFTVGAMVAAGVAAACAVAVLTASAIAAAVAGVCKDGG